MSLAICINNGESVTLSADTLGVDNDSEVKINKIISSVEFVGKKPHTVFTALCGDWTDMRKLITGILPAKGELDASGLAITSSGDGLFVSPGGMRYPLMKVFTAVGDKILVDRAYEIYAGLDKRLIKYTDMFLSTFWRKMNMEYTAVVCKIPEEKEEK